MSVFYWAGYAVGWVLVAAALAAPLLLLVPRVRRRMTRPLLRRVTGRRPGDVAARIAELELQQELLDGNPEPLAFIHVRGTLSYQNIEQIKRKFEEASRTGRSPVILPPA